MHNPDAIPEPTFDYIDTTWMDHANCKGTNTNVFFPERGDQVEAAKQICEPCPVKTQCLAYALAIPGTSGIWGGTSGRERRQMKAGQPRHPRRHPRQHGTQTGYKQHLKHGEPACPACRAANTAATRLRQYKHPKD